MSTQCTETVRLPFPNPISDKYRVTACPPDEAYNSSKHTFYVEAVNDAGETDYITAVVFQHGELSNPETPHNGVLSTILIQIIIEHLKSFQGGAFGDRNTAIAITHLEDAYFRLAARADERNARGVLGAHKV